MSFPRSYSALKDMVLSALLEVKTCRDIVRRSGIRLTGGTATGLPEIYGSFTLMDTDEPLGYTEDHSATSPRPFPGGFAYAMDRLADWGDFSQARLLATVTEAGETGSTLEVMGTGVIVFWWALRPAYYSGGRDVRLEGGNRDGRGRCNRVGS